MKLKKIKGLALIVLLALGVVIYLEACKKNALTPINNIENELNDHSGFTDEAKKIVGKIKKFKTQLVDKENVMRSGLYMPIDSIIWNVEALFNAEYAFPERRYAETVKQELSFFVDVNDDNEAPFSMVADLYDEITDAVRQVYANDGIILDKSLKAVVIDKGETVGNRVEINVYVISGRADKNVTEKDPVQGPFGPGDCWYFGEYGGTCDDPSVFCDAAEIIEDSINYHYGGKSVPQEGFRRLNVGMFRISLNGNEYVDENGESYIYYHTLNDDPPFYLDYELLNYYYTRELEVLLHLLPSDLINQKVMPEFPAFIEVDIIGLIDYVGNENCLHHKNYVIYGSSLDIPCLALPQVDLL